MRAVRNGYAALLTVVHTAWLERRDRTPWPWCIPIALVVAVIGPR